MSLNKKPHILFLFSDTGGGHRSAAEAIIEALQLEYGEAFTTEMLDFFKSHAPLPFNKMPDWYPDMVKAPHLWGLSFKISDGRRRARAITASMWPYVGHAARAMVREHPADLVVTVHPLATTIILKALGRNRPPFITIVTDWVSNHALWYDKRSDLILVPTQMARQGAIRYDMDPKKVIVTGFPVARRHCISHGSKDSLREQLGWPKEKIIVLLLGGREGMGPLPKTLEAINEADLDVTLIVVAGKNERLRENLEKKHWKIPVKIYGYTTLMPDFMRASDVVITKAGAATVAEALNAGLPMVFHTRLPGQEDGNVEYVTSSGAGVWAPDPKKVVEILEQWVKSPKDLRGVAKMCRKIAQPNAAINIAHLLGKILC